MIATHAKESQEDRICNKDFERLKEFQSSGLIAMDKLNTQMMMMKNTSSTNQSNFDGCFSDKLKRFTEIDQSSSSEGSSTEEEYSPKSVEEFGLKRFVHHQVLKIREEDSHIGEDNIREISLKNKLALIHDLTSQQVRALIFSRRPILPSSPLSGKSSIDSFH